MITKVCGAMMVVIAGSLPAMANPCRQQVVEVVKTVEVVTPVIQVQNVVVPVYGIIPYPNYYAPTMPVQAMPQQQSSMPGSEDRLLKVLEMLVDQNKQNLEFMKGMRQEMRAGLNLPNNPDPPVVPKLKSPAMGEQLPAPKESAASFEALVNGLRMDCARCHNESTPTKEGGKLVMFKNDGSFSPVTDDQGKAIVTKLMDGTMPPPDKAKIPDERRQAYIAAFTKK